MKKTAGMKFHEGTLVEILKAFAEHILWPIYGNSKLQAYFYTINQ